MRELIVAAGLLVVACTASCTSNSSPVAPLSPQESCDVFIDFSIRCGIYMVGAYRGATEAEDRALCAALYETYTEHCQALWSDLARCSAEVSCSAGEACEPALRAFGRDCSGMGGP